MFKVLIKIDKKRAAFSDSSLLFCEGVHHFFHFKLAFVNGSFNWSDTQLNRLFLMNSIKHNAAKY
jgi:hypothetical protein